MVWPDCRTAELQRGPQAGQRSMVVRINAVPQHQHSVKARLNGSMAALLTAVLQHIGMARTVQCKVAQKTCSIFQCQRYMFCHGLPGRAAPGSYRGPGVPDAPAAVRTSKTKKDLGQTDPKYRLPSPAQSEPATLPAARDTPLLHTPYVHNSWAFHFPHCNAAQATPGAKNLPVRQSLSSV